MAAKVPDNERDERIILVGEYYTNTPNASVRSTAEYFSNNFFKISFATVSDYIKRYKKMYPDKSDLVQQVVDSRKPVTYHEEHIQNRILKEAELVLEGYTMENIADLFDLEYWTVVRDLGMRLAKIDMNLYEQVKNSLSQNTLDNLNYTINKK